MSPGTAAGAAEENPNNCSNFIPAAELLQECSGGRAAFLRCTTLLTFLKKVFDTI